MCRARQWRGQYMTREKANRINDALMSAKVPDRTALEKESKEFIELIKKRRGK